MWSLMWRGMGWLVPVVVIVSFLVTQFAVNLILGADYYQDNSWPKDVAIILGMLFIGLAGWHYNYRKRTSHKDPLTELTRKSPQHHFLFIPIQYWVLIMPLFFVWAFKTSEETRAIHMAYIDEPQTGDIYLLNMKKINDGYDKIYKYGAMKVVSFDVDSIQFVLSKEFYKKPKGPRIDYRKGNMKNDNYFDQANINYKKEDLIRLRNERAVMSIKREP